jgi:hypothetical protein
MRRLRFGGILMVLSTVLLVAGGVVYGTGRHGLGGAFIAVAVVGFGLVIAPAMSAEGRAAEHAGVMGRRADPSGFDRPRDQSGL